ncbi:hypothetical protein GQF61_00780 [Sphingobacterium sp. DK4209]|uniref:Uncharacterized protein n=1 Tax=Sphingobacterium zhuxiongii TaxID=2662364 RepID=A0A5Q0Q9B3_9SPHI|nr:MULTISPECIES: hypothetical protein [unclassified Sphingobacterium]MVZ64372.1 hypothetical protein [Sphingobacterium sp. DK4209]QGA25719.1 hypothetical protein GFH32_05005 [Sphingobacterium sp. dk4302]
MEELFNAMTFEEAFERFIKGQKAVDYGVRQPEAVMLSNGYQAFPCGYYTLFENGFKLIVSGFNVSPKSSQHEAWVLDEDDRPVGYKEEAFIDFD